jgi:hypothetical protein
MAVPRVRTLSLSLATALIAAMGCQRGMELATPRDSVDGLVSALRSSGASVLRSGNLTQPFFSVPAEVLAVNGERIQVFQYDDEHTSAVEAGRIGADGRIRGAEAVQWAATPHFFRTCRLTVLYVGEDNGTTRLLGSVLGPELRHS